MTATDIKRAKKIIDKHKEYTDHYADQEYTKEGILKMVEEYTLYTEPVSEEGYYIPTKKGEIGKLMVVSIKSMAKGRLIGKHVKWMQQRQVKQIVEGRDYKKRYEEIVNSDWFKVAYDNKPIGDTLKII